MISYGDGVWAAFRGAEDLAVDFLRALLEEEVTGAIWIGK